MRADLIQVRDDGRHRVWSMTVEGADTQTTWGQIGGELQTTQDTHIAINVGKKNEKSPEVVAMEEYERKILSKTREGYVPWDCVTVPEAPAMLDAMLPLPQALRFWKPLNDLSIGMQGVARDDPDRLLYLRKREGEAFFIQSRPGRHNYTMYSRTMQTTWKDEPNLPWFERFPTILQGIEMVSPPPGTVLAGEIVYGGAGMRDDISFVNTVLRSSTAYSLSVQQDSGWPLHFYLWYVPFYGGQNCGNLNINDQLALVSKMVERDASGVFIPPETRQYSDIETALDDAVRFSWEGWVIHDTTTPIGPKLFTLHGKTPRPHWVCKAKPDGEDDFVVFWDPEQGIGTYGTGKNRQRVGSVALYQYDQQGTLVFISNCAGISDDMRSKLSTPGAYPRVWKVRYQKRFYLNNGDSSNAIVLPRYEDERTDKSPIECINPNL